MGIPSADLPHIFRRLLPAGETPLAGRDQGQPASGLSIVKRAIEATAGDDLGQLGIPGQGDEVHHRSPLRSGSKAGSRSRSECPIPELSSFERARVRSRAPTPRRPPRPLAAPDVRIGKSCSVIIAQGWPRRRRGLTLGQHGTAIQPRLKRLPRCPLPLNASPPSRRVVIFTASVPLPANTPSTYRHRVTPA